MVASMIFVRHTKPTPAARDLQGSSFSRIARLLALHEEKQAEINGAGQGIEYIDDSSVAGDGDDEATQRRAGDGGKLPGAAAPGSGIGKYVGGHGLRQQR